MRALSPRHSPTRASVLCLTPSPGTPGEGWGEGSVPLPHHDLPHPHRHYHRLLFLLALLASFATAAAFRLPQLSLRPMHCDESINADKFRELFDKGLFTYNPREYHGPTLFYATRVAAFFDRAHHWLDLNEANYRQVTAVFGILSILLLFLLADGLGKLATSIAAPLLALSPAMVYFSRYFIHEMLFVFFTLLAIAAGWRLFRTRHRRWIFVSGLSLGLMHATKETFSLVFFSMFASVILCSLWHRHPLHRHLLAMPAHRWASHAGGITLGALASVLLFSNFLQPGRGPIDSILTYASYLRRAGASIHDHPFNYYFQILGWNHARNGPIFTEGFILVLALVGILAAITGQGIRKAHLHLARFLTVYTIILTLIHCILPYKTPWNALNFLLGFILLAGIGAGALLRNIPNHYHKALATLLLLAGMANLGWQSYNANFRYPADQRNPYVYGHSSTDVIKMGDLIESLAAFHPDHHQMLIKVAANDNYWPIPWYLRRFTNVGYYPQAPEILDAPITLIEADLAEGKDDILLNANDYHVTGPRGLRPGVAMYVYVKKDPLGRLPAIPGHSPPCPARYQASCIGWRK